MEKKLLPWESKDSDPGEYMKNLNIAHSHSQEKKIFFSPKNSKDPFEEFEDSLKKKDINSKFLSPDCAGNA